jgi:hypothetical protein
MLDAALSEFMNAEDLKRLSALADEKLPTEERAEAERVLSPYQYATSFQRANIPSWVYHYSSKPRPQRPMVGRLRHRAQTRCHVGVMRIVMNGGK